MPKQTGPVQQYSKELFQDSLITGVPQIVTTRNIPRKILKSVVLACCIVGFVYQTSEFLKIFWSYPTVLDIDVEYPEVIESPAITFCNLNGVKRTQFCNKFPKNCSIPINRSAFCQAFPTVCKKNQDGDLTFPVLDGLHFEQTCSREDLKNFGHLSSDTLQHCLKKEKQDYVECSWDSLIHMPMSNGNTGYRNCYTLYSSVNSNTLNKYRLPVPKKKDVLFHLAFDVEPDEYFRPDREVGVIVALHSPNKIINPFFDGFVIKPGNLYNVHLKVVEEKLLPSPYETQCQDYKAQWKMRGDKGPLSQEMCISECVYNASMSLCNCVIPDVLYPHNDRVCTEDELDCFDFNLSECYNVCQQPCDITDFESDVQERKLENGMASTLEEMYSDDSITTRRAAVLVFLKRPEIIVYSHRPQYEDIEVFSFMGGYVGMWLGVSLIAVFDFLESVALIIRFWIRKKIQS